jgi:branched-chain amino acid transport system ATP-binding protein
MPLEALPDPKSAEVPPKETMPAESFASPNRQPEGKGQRVARQALLEVKDLFVSYGAITALKGVSLSVGQGEVVALIGANGAGKTSTLRAVSGLVKPAKGTIHLRGVDITGLKAHVVVSKGLAHAPEGRGIFPNLTVQENLDLGAWLRKDTADIAKDLEHCFGLFPRLKERREQMAGTLSGGEQQMLAISRALMSRPTLLLLDEPSLGLAPQVTQTIFRILRDVNRAGMSLLLVEQNAHLALGLAHWAYVLETGSLVMQGTGQELLASEDIRKAYLGE